jgi:hypothetical protein
VGPSGPDAARQAPKRRAPVQQELGQLDSELERPERVGLPRQKPQRESPGPLPGQRGLLQEQPWPRPPPAGRRLERGSNEREQPERLPVEQPPPRQEALQLAVEQAVVELRLQRALRRWERAEPRWLGLRLAEERHSEHSLAVSLFRRDGDGITHVEQRTFVEKTAKIRGSSG